MPNKGLVYTNLMLMLKKQKTFPIKYKNTLCSVLFLGLRRDRKCKEVGGRKLCCNLEDTGGEKVIIS